MNKINNFSHNFRIHAENVFLSNAIAIHIFTHLQNGDISVLSGLEFTQHKPDKVIDPFDALIFPRETAQQLMDSLWQCGLRPSEGTGSAGAMRAVENHLKDMQDLSRCLLSMVETDRKRE